MKSRISGKDATTIAREALKRRPIEVSAISPLVSCRQVRQPVICEPPGVFFPVQQLHTPPVPKESRRSYLLVRVPRRSASHGCIRSNAKFTVPSLPVGCARPNVGPQLVQFVATDDSLPRRHLAPASHNHLIETRPAISLLLL